MDSGQDGHRIRDLLRHHALAGSSGSLGGKRFDIVTKTRPPLAAGYDRFSGGRPMVSTFRPEPEPWKLSGTWWPGFTWTTRPPKDIATSFGLEGSSLDVVLLNRCGSEANCSVQPR